MLRFCRFALQLAHVTTCYSVLRFPKPWKHFPLSQSSGPEPGERSKCSSLHNIKMHLFDIYWIYIAFIGIHIYILYYIWHQVTTAAIAVRAACFASSIDLTWFKAMCQSVNPSVRWTCNSSNLGQALNQKTSGKNLNKNIRYYRPLSGPSGELCKTSSKIRSPWCIDLCSHLYHTCQRRPCHTWSSNLDFLKSNFASSSTNKSDKGYAQKVIPQKKKWKNLPCAVCTAGIALFAKHTTPGRQGQNNSLWGY